MKKFLLAGTALFLLGLASPAFAATCDGAAIPGMIVGTDGSLCYYLKVASDGSIAVTGTFSASLAGFNPTAGATANLTDVVNTSQDVALPAGADVIVTNKGTVTANVRLTVGAGTAVSTDIPLVAGAAAGFHVLTTTHISAIAPTGTGTGSTAAQLNIQGGTGLATGYGGGSSTGGGGGAVTVADGADVTQGAKADAKSTATDTTAVTAQQVLKEISFMEQNPASRAVTNAGTFATQAAQSGTWTVQPGNTANTTAWKVDGSAVIQPIKIDQTTPGTTNGVVVNSAVGLAQSAAIAGVTTSPISAESLSTTPTRTTAQVDIAVQTLNGAMAVQPYALPDSLVSGTTSAMTGTTSTSLVASPGGSLHNYITNITCVNSHATVGTFVTVQDGSGGTALYTLAAASVFGGSSITFPAPLRQPTAATALFVANVTTGANVICSASGFKGL